MVTLQQLADRHGLTVRQVILDSGVPASTLYDWVTARPAALSTLVRGLACWLQSVPPGPVHPRAYGITQDDVTALTGLSRRTLCRYAVKRPRTYTLLILGTVAPADVRAPDL